MNNVSIDESLYNTLYFVAYHEYLITREKIF